MRFASQFLSEVMRSEVLVSDLMSDCAACFVCWLAGASVSSVAVEWNLSWRIRDARWFASMPFVDGKIAARITRAGEFVRSAAKPVEDDSGGVGVWDE